MMVIVEGPDGAGKSTLVRQLDMTFDDLEVMDPGMKDRSRLHEITRNMTRRALERAPSGAPFQIWDRLFFSELIYCQLPGRGVCAFNPEQIVFTFKVLMALDVVVIICLPPLDVVEENIKDTEQMEGVHENIEQIYRSYEDLSSSHYLYDYTAEGKPLRDLTKRLNKNINLWKTRSLT